MKFKNSLRKSLVLFQVECNNALNLDSYNMAEFVSPSFLRAFTNLGQCLLDKNIYSYDNSRSKK